MKLDIHIKSIKCKMYTDPKKGSKKIYKVSLLHPKILELQGRLNQKKVL